MKNEVTYKLQVAWDGETYVTYEDEITLSNLSIEKSNIVGFAGGLSLTFDDTNGELYTLFQSVNFHKAPARLLKDDIIFFDGEITSPVNWDENERKINITIDSKVEDREVGFSLEESTINCAKQSVNDPWPLCFGNVLHVPATKVVQKRTGTLMNQMGIVDPMLQPEITATLNAFYQEYYIFTFGQTQLAAISDKIPPVLLILDAYIAAMSRRRNLVILRDALIAAKKDDFNLQAVPALADLWEVLFDDFDLADFKEAIIGRNPSIDEVLAFNTFLDGQSWETKLVQLNLANLGLFFKWFHQFIEQAKQLAKVYSDMLNMVKRAIDNMQKLYAHYIYLRNEYCKQLETVKNCVTVNCGTTFPQGETTDIIIDNLRWRGEFTDEEFCFDTPGLPLSLYENLAVDEWINEEDACGHTDNFTNLDKFYLEDDSVNLTGLYALVKTENQISQRLYRTFEISSVDATAGTITLVDEVNMDIASPYTTSGPMVEGTGAARANGTTVVFNDNPDLSPVSIDGTSVIYLDIAGGWRAFDVTAVDNFNKNVTIRGTIYTDNYVTYKISDTPTHGPKAAYTDGLSNTVQFYETPDLSGVVSGMLFGAFVRVDYSHHVIKITEQEENKVTFDLVDRGASQSVTVQNGSGARDSFTVLPFYGYGRGGLPWTAPVLVAEAEVPDEQLNSIVLAALLGSGINYITDEEHRDLLAIQNLANQRRILGTPILFSFPTARDMFHVIGEDIVEVLKVAKLPLPDWFDPIYPIPQAEMPKDLHWVADYGAEVLDATAEHEVFVANLVPSEIKSIMAYYPTPDGDVLMPIPSRYYTYNEAEDLGVFTVTSIRFPRALQSIEPKWKDKIYVSLNSTVGPNVIDIMEHLIDTYTDFTVDATFDALRTHADTYPCNFALLDRKNVLTQLQEIAWQARYQLTLKNGVFSLIYLSSEPTPIATLSDANTLVGTEALILNTTEDLVTKMNITWREDYLPDHELSFILRHNIDKYGLQEQSYNWYIYTDRDLIIKSATYWLIQYANMWTHLQFSTDINNTWNAGDCITVENFYDAVKGIIIRQEYDFENYLKHQTLWLPIRLGEETPYTFAWPADADETDMFPTIDEIDSAGSQSPGRNLDRLPTGITT